MAVKIPVGVINAIDEVLRLKNEIEILTAQKAEASDTVKQYMSDHGLDAIETKRAQAIYSTRATRTVDPEVYWEAIGGDVDKLLASVNVRIDPNPKAGKAGARSFLGEDDLMSICETSDVPVLTIKKLPVAAQTPKAAAPPKRKVSVRLPRRRTMTA